MHNVILPNNPMEEIEKKLKGKELYELRKKQKQLEKQKAKQQEKLKEAPKKIGRLIVYGIIGVGAVGGLGWFIASRPNLPPTTIQGHIEQSPPAHIVSQPIPENIQKHMLEHADGRGVPGIIIQYNCDEFECESGLIARLTCQTIS
jgi:hypothetical protein